MTADQITDVLNAMGAEQITDVLNRPYAQELIASRIPARVAYTALDGTPRVIPVNYHWNGSTLVMCSAPKSAKVAALRANPRVAITIDSEDMPPKLLLLRGAASVEIADGVPEVFLTAARRRTPDAHWDAWAGGVPCLYPQMAVITITLDWAKLIDFETCAPKAEEDLARAAQPGQTSWVTPIVRRSARR
jgi:ribosomal protein L24E